MSPIEGCEREKGKARGRVGKWQKGKMIRKIVNNVHKVKEVALIDSKMCGLRSVL